MITIYDAQGQNIRFQTPINIGSERVFKLMSDDYITLKFSVEKPIYFKLGDYCDCDFGRFELITPYQPNYNANTSGYDYELRLDAQYMKWRNKIMRHAPMTGAAECSFTLTSTPDVHLEKVLENIHALATESTTGGTCHHPEYLYNGTIPYKIAPLGNNIERNAKTIQYDKLSIIDALSQIAEQYECEWWIEGNIIHLGTCEQENEYIDLEIGVNVSEMSRSNSSEKYATRIIPFGSDRNISPRYRKDLIFDVKEIAKGDLGTVYISDTSRPLEADWFPASHIDGESVDIKKVTFDSNQYYPYDNGKCERQSPVLTLGGFTADTWVADFSDFHPGISIKSTKNIRALWMDVKIVCSKKGETDTDYSITVPIDITDFSYTLYNQSLPLRYDVDMMQISFCVRAELYSGYLDGIGLTFEKDHNIYIKRASSRAQINNLTLVRIDSAGNEIEEVGAIYSSKYKDDNLAPGYNWFSLPPFCSTFLKGTRFMVREILPYKVKSAYFTSKYCGYDEITNVVKNGIVASRLMLPESYGKPYIDIEDGLDMAQGVEEVVVFDEVYPKAICTVTEINTVQRKESVENDDGTTYDRTFTAFQIKDDFFTSKRPFKEEYIVVGKTLKITFQDGKRYEEGDEIPEGSHIGDLIYPESGTLNGWSFEVQFKQDKDGSAIWEIVRDNTYFIPNDILRPRIGDQFVLEGFDVSCVNELYVSQAENELVKVANKYIKERNVDTSTYDCKLLPKFVKNGPTLVMGMRINLINEAYMTPTIDENGRRWGRKSRVIGWRFPLDIPYDNPTYTIGEKPAYSRLGKIENQINALKYSQKSEGVGVAVTSQSDTSNSVYLITQTDSTPASDTNTFSALRSRLEFILRKAAQTINYLWTFAKGIRIGDYESNGNGAKIDTNGDAEFEGVMVRNTLDIAAETTIGDDLSVMGNTDVKGHLNVGGDVTFKEFQPDAYGAKLWHDAQGNVHFETDYLKARKKFEAREVEIQEMTHVGGCQIISPASAVIDSVEPWTPEWGDVQDFFFCNIKSEDGTTRVFTEFEEGDLVRCETFNLVERDGYIGNHYYWRKVIGVLDKESAKEEGRQIIVLSNIEGEYDTGSDAPMAGDKIVVVGNDLNPERANLIMMASYGSGSPYIYQYKGIHTFSLNNDNLKTAISPNGNIFKGDFIIDTGNDEQNVGTMLQLTKEEVELQADRVTENESRIADLKLTADGLTSTVERHTNFITEGCGINLLTGTNKGVKGWNFFTDSQTADGNVWICRFDEDNDEIYKRMRVNIPARSDANLEYLTFNIDPSIIKEGEVYSLSFHMSAVDVSEMDIAAFIAIPKGEFIATGDNITYKGDGRYSLRLTGRKDGVKNGAHKLIIGFTSHDWTQFDIWNLKLEKGYYATPYTEAPEDVYFDMSSKIEQSEQKILLEVNKTIKDESAGITEQYTSAIEQSAEEIDAKVKKVGDDLTESMSLIRQSAEEINLKVDKVIGYRNLVTGYFTGQGWTLIRVNGTIFDFAPNDGAFTFATLFGSNRLKTPCFTLDANKEYTLSFKCLYRGGESASSFYIYDEDGNRLVGESFLNETEPDEDGYVKVIHTFATDKISDGAYLLIAIYPNSGIDKDISIKDVMVEEGGVAHEFADFAEGLLSTGIDIEHKKITFTSDNIYFQDNEGNVDMFIADGKVKAKYINVDRLVSGDENGQRVEILPEHKAIEIYDADNSKCTTLSGEQIEDVEEVFPHAVSFSTINRNGYDSLNSTDSKTDTGYIDKTLLQFNIAEPTEFSLKGFIDTFAKSKQAVSTDAGSQTIRNNVSIEAYLKVMLNGQYAEDYTRSISVNATGGEEMGNSIGDNLLDVKLSKPGSYTIKVVYRITINKINGTLSGVYGSIQWRNVRAYATPFTIPRKYDGRYFANGFTLGDASDNLVSAYHDANDGLMKVLFKSKEGYGFRFNENGLAYRFPGSEWIAQPLMLLNGIISSGEWEYCKTFNGELPTLTKENISSGSYYKIKIPASWTHLGITPRSIRIQAIAISNTPNGISVTYSTKSTSEDIDYINIYGSDKIMITIEKL